MSPTDQPGGRAPATLKAVSSLPATLLGSTHAASFLKSGSSEAVGSTPSSANEAQTEPATNILVISVGYPKSRKKKKACDEKGEEKTEFTPLELKSVPNDLEIQMARHDPIVSDAERENSDRHQQRKPSSLLMSSGQLESIMEAASLGGSLVIYYSGHCGWTGGEWAVTFNDGHWEYEEENAKKEGTAKDEATKPELPYIVSSDCQRIQGRDVVEALSAGLKRNGGRKMTIMLIFDACFAATFFGMKLDARSLMSLLSLSVIVDNTLVLPYVYRPEALGGLEVEPHDETKYGESQIIFLASTQFHQGAGTFVKGEPPKEHGAVTWLVDDFLKDNVPKTAENLIEWLYDACKSRQTPQIRALHRINDLRLLLG
ncbi:hypothetical protein FRC00_000002 [Tulasnella sp. 408]|nr:hypothetical protein FRC00_000002 [Tulasnella sp. 408]